MATFITIQHIYSKRALKPNSWSS